MAPANPKSLDDLVIPEDYKLTIDGKPFLLFDSFDRNTGKPRILIFSTTENLGMMNDCDRRYVYVDGTFSSSPTIFYQLYTIHGIKYSNVLPSVFALLPNKTEETYVHLFNTILKLKPGLNPKSIMLDFEQATINAVKKSVSTNNFKWLFFSFLPICMATRSRKWTCSKISRRF